MTTELRKIIVVGGDIAAWIVAAGLAKGLAGQQTRIVVAEREYQLDRFADNSVPSILSFLKFLNIDERDFVSQTGAGPNLGTAYRDWSATGQDFIHAFGAYGSMLDRVEFQHFAAKAYAAGDEAGFDEYSVGATAARLGRFAHPPADPRSVLSQLAYSINVDNEQFRRYLKLYALSKGVTLIEDDVVAAAKDPTTGFVQDVTLGSGETIGADFFFDCSAGASRLIDECLEVPMNDWSEGMPFNRRVSLRRAGNAEIPCVIQKVLDDGWYRSIPLRDDNVAELHYDSNVTSDSDVANALRCAAAVDSDQDVLVADIRHGCRQDFWSGNCVAVGASAGDTGNFVINQHHLAQSAVLRWLDHYPNQDCAPSFAHNYNRACHAEYTRVRDIHTFVLTAAAAGTSEFWRKVQRIPIPESLKYRLDLFKARGNFAFYEAESLLPSSWISLLIGMGCWPQRHDPLADAASDEQVRGRLEEIRRLIRDAVSRLPKYEEYWNRYTGSAAH